MNSVNCVKESSFSRALSAMDTLMSFKRCGAKGVYRQMSCQGITRQSAVNTNYRGTQEKKQDCQSDKHIKRKSGKG